MSTGNPMKAEGTHHRVIVIGAGIAGVGLGVRLLDSGIEDFVILERNDSVGPYGKSLLYLVSNAFEGRRETPLLGMETFLTRDPDLNALFAGQVDGRPAVVVAGLDQGPGSVSRSSTHGGFDNDPDTLNSVLHRILNGPPPRPFTTRDLQF